MRDYTLTARVWSDKRLGGAAGGLRSYDVAPDGKRIVALMPVETPDVQRSRHQVTFLLNFADELRRKVPMGKQRHTPPKMAERSESKSLEVC